MSGFETTRWSLVLHAGNDDAQGRRSLEALCAAYRAPVHAFVRHTTGSSHDAEDLTQAFFAYFLERRVHASADPERGRFRSYLLGAVRNFLSTQRRQRVALKRGGDLADAGSDALDALTDERAEADPEQVFEREWALTVLTRALDRLQTEARIAGKETWFLQLRESLVSPPGETDYAQLAETLGARRNTLAVAVHRLRQRLDELVREELADTVAGTAEILAEQRDLGAFLR